MAAPERVPPHDVIRQDAVVAASLLDGDARSEALSVLSSDHMYGDVHRLLWMAVEALDAQGETVDVVTVAGWLRDRDQLRRIGGAATIGTLVDCTPSVAPRAVRDYATHIVALWRQRQVIALGHRIVGEGYGDVGDVSEWTDLVESRLYELVHSDRVSTTTTLREAIIETFEQIRASAERGGELTGLSTGLTAYDRCTSGLHPGELTVVAARPGMGKSALAFGWAATVAAQRMGVYVLSLEMPSVQVAQRVICSMSRASIGRMRAGAITQTDYQAMTDAARVAAEWPMVIDEDSGTTVTQLRARLRRQCSRWRRDGVEPGLVVVDYIQLMSEPSAQSREQEISYISRHMKGLAKALGVPVVVLSQLNRSVEARADKRPLLSDLRESGAIEQDADCVTMIYRDDYYHPDSEDRGLAELIIAKQRSGPTGPMLVRWYPECTTYGDHDVPEMV